MSVFTVSRIGRTVLVGLGLAATTPLSWWIGGLVPDEVRPQDNPDYMWHPIKLSSGVETAIGLGSMVIVGVAILRFYRAIRRHTLRREWFGVIAPLAAIAAYAGFAYRAATMPVIGANIGGGLMILGAGPFVVTMVAVSAIFARRLRARD
jgi:uncharacterized membrane protein YfcA